MENLQIEFEQTWQITTTELPVNVADKSYNNESVNNYVIHVLLPPICTAIATAAQNGQRQLLAQNLKTAFVPSCVLNQVKQLLQDSGIECTYNDCVSSTIWTSMPANESSGHMIASLSWDSDAPIVSEITDLLN